MPFVLSESIHYNPTDTQDALDKIRQFAVTLGWTVDDYVYMGGISQLQLWSPGYGAQEMCYRIQVEDNALLDQTLTMRAVVPGYRGSGFSFGNSVTWGGASTLYMCTSLPIVTFDALYLYGTKRFISAIFHIDPIAVVTIQIGTWDLFESWRSYGPGLNFIFNPQEGWSATGANDRYTSMASNPASWIPPMAQRWSTSQGYHIWWEGDKRANPDYAANYRPASTTAIGSEAGEFNKATALCRYNSYTAKRMAFQSTFFARSPTLGVWYPIGVSPFAWVNGRDLTIGEVIKFGTDEYRCFPSLFSTYERWQAYRIA